MFSLLTGAKSFKTNRWVGSARLNRLGLHIGRYWAGFKCGLFSALPARSTYSWIPRGPRLLEGRYRKLLSATEATPAEEGIAPV